MDGCVCISAGDGSAGGGVTLLVNDASHVVRNTICIATGATAWTKCMGVTFASTVQNCIVVDGPQGFTANSAAVVFDNCVSIGATTDFVDIGSAVLTNCASEDATAVGTDCITGIDQFRAFEDHEGNDFRPLAGGPLAGAGVAISGGLLDIAGVAHGSDPLGWHIGAYAQSVQPVAGFAEMLTAAPGVQAGLPLYMAEARVGETTLAQMDSQTGSTCTIFGRAGDTAPWFALDELTPAAPVAEVPVWPQMSIAVTTYVDPASAWLAE